MVGASFGGKNTIMFWDDRYIPGRCVPIREVSSFQMVVCTGLNGVGTWRCVPIREVSSFQRVVCTGLNGVGT